MEPKKVTKDFVPPTTVKTVVHEEPEIHKSEDIKMDDSMRPPAQESVPEKAAGPGLPHSCDDNFKEDPYLMPKKYKSLPNNNVTKIKDKIKFVKEKPKYSKRDKWYLFLKIFMISIATILIIFGVIFTYQLIDGKLQPYVSNNFTIDPIINVDNPIDNQYDIDTANEYEFTIQNNITCPEVTCNCGGEE